MRETGHHLLTELDRARLDFERGLRGYRQDVLFYASLPEVMGLGRALEHGGVDPVKVHTVEEWKEEVRSVFANALKSRPGLVQLRVIGRAGGGREVVRVDRDSQTREIVVISDVDLQVKGDRYYVERGFELGLGEVYLSPIDLNQEHGEIEEPHLPVARAVTPLVTEAGETWGVVVLNVDAGGVLADLSYRVDPTLQFYLTNPDGEYLVHPDPGRGFAHEFSDDALTWDREFEVVAGSFVSAEVLAESGMTAVAASGDGAVLWVVRREVGMSVGGGGERVVLRAGVEERRVREAAMVRVRPLIYERMGEAGVMILILILLRVRWDRIQHNRLEVLIAQAPLGVAMFDVRMRYLAASQRWLEDQGLEGVAVVGRSFYELSPRVPEVWREAHREALMGRVVRRVADGVRAVGGGERFLDWEVRPWRRASGAIGGVIMHVQDVTLQHRAEEQLRALNRELDDRVHRRTEELSEANKVLVRANEEIRDRELEREQLIGKLRQSLAEVQLLSGLLPMCAWCKNVRDDSGYWQKVESYLTEKNLVTFTHSMCPDCMEKHFPQDAEDEGNEGPPSLSAGG
ncbi:MAG: hypothetical protein RI897_3017 [Verrucomicrobiota bacterium]